MFRELGLFAGIRGFSLGLELTGGFTPAAFSEIDPYAQDILRKHWPDVPIIPDVHDVSRRALVELGAWPVDVVTGGFPCQDTSAANARGAGLDGPRSRLWWEMHRVIAEVRPRYAIIENSPQLRAKGLDRVLGALDQIGYDAEWNCIPASSVGACHRRDRLWIVAYPRGEQSESEGDAFEWAGAARLSEAPTVSDSCLAGLPLSEREALQREGWRLQRRAITERRWWASEPDVGRVVPGVPNRVDRLRCLGNAVVPQIPYLLGQAILLKEKFG